MVVVNVIGTPAGVDMVVVNVIGTPAGVDMVVVNVIGTPAQEWGMVVLMTECPDTAHTVS